LSNDTRHRRHRTHPTNSAESTTQQKSSYEVRVFTMAEMHSWTRAASPNIKFEGSPTESLLSTPDEMYPSLFGTSSSQATTVNPLEMMSPESLADDSQPDLKMLAGLTALSQTALAQSPAPTASVAGTPEPEKKQAKKRKSWGQVLPEPKTNLPPRYVMHNTT